MLQLADMSIDWCIAEANAQAKENPYPELSRFMLAVSLHLEALKADVSFLSSPTLPDAAFFGPESPALIRRLGPDNVTADWCIAQALAESRLQRNPEFSRFMEAVAHHLDMLQARLLSNGFSGFVQMLPASSFAGS